MEVIAIVMASASGEQQPAKKRTTHSPMVDVQNATLAGGVAIGSAANLAVLSPAESLLIGVLGGVLSVLGYTKIQPKIERHLRVHDTCGVNNLHGMPAILAGVASAIIIAYSGDQTTFTDRTSASAYNATYGDINGRTPGQQAGVQVICVVVSFSMAVASGMLCGLFCKLLGSPEEDQLFLDRGYWEVPNLELPFYFDQRGEINREMAEANASKHGGSAFGSKHGGSAFGPGMSSALMSQDYNKRGPGAPPVLLSHEYGNSNANSNTALAANGTGPSLISNELINMKLDLMLQNQIRMFPPPSASTELRSPATSSQSMPYPAAPDASSCSSEAI